MLRRITHHLGFYLTPSTLYGTLITRHRSGHMQHQAHHQLTLNDNPTNFMTALSINTRWRTTHRCHVTLSNDYTHQQILSLDTALPKTCLPQYLAHHSTSLFQHPWESLYCDYLPLTSHATESTYVISACKQSIVQEHLLSNLPPRCRLATLQVDWLCGFHLAFHASHRHPPPYTVLYCDTMHLIHYQFSANELHHYEAHSLSSGYDTVLTDLQAQLTEKNTTLYITGPNEALYHALTHELSTRLTLIPLHEALEPQVHVTHTDHVERHNELIAALTALTPRSCAC